MNTRLKVWLSGLALLLAVSLVAGCKIGGSSGGSSSSAVTAPASYSYLGTQSPGDVWNWNMTASTFTATNVTKNYTYSGTKSTLASGFYKLVVTATTDPGVTVPATAYAVEFPNTALLVEPAGTAPRVVVGASAGACPTAADTYNWVTMPRLGWSSASDEAYGTATSTLSGATFTFDMQPNMLNGSAMAPYSQSGWTCSNGNFTNASYSYAFGVTPSGIFVSDEGTNAGGMIGVNAPATTVNLADVMSKTYRGFQFSTDTTTVANVTEPIGGEPGTGANSGKMSGFSYGGDGNVETNTRCTTCDAVIDLATQSSPGLVTGTITSGGGTINATFVISQINGKYVMFGVTTTGSGAPYNFLVIQQ